MAETCVIKDTSSFGLLPNEICSLIFSYLSPLQDNRLRLALVCKRWRHIIFETPSLWKTFSSNYRKTRAVVNCPPAGDTERENIVFSQKVTNIILRFGRFIKDLDLSNINYRYLKKAGVMKVLKELKVLSVFILHTLPCDRHLVKALSDSSNSLREFTARGVTYRCGNGPIVRIPDEVLLDLADKFPFLRRLVLYDFHASYETVTEMLQKLTHLKELEIVFTFEDEFSYRGVSGHFLRNYRLNEAGAVFQNLSVSQHASKVTRLNLDDVFLSGSQLKAVVENLKNLKKLDLAAFGDENISEKVVAKFHSDSLKDVVIWDVCYISALYLSIPSATKLFLSDLNLEAVKVDAPSLEELHIGSIVLHNVELTNYFELNTGKLQKLDIMELGEHTPFSMRDLRNLLYSNQALKVLEIECFDLAKLEITDEMCPAVTELSITGSARDYCISCYQLRHLDIKGDCIDPDLDDKQRCISVSGHELQSLQIHQLPNLVNIKLFCRKISSFSLCENDFGDKVSIPKHQTQFVLGQETVIGSFMITNIKPERIHCSLENEITNFRLSNCNLTDEEMSTLIRSDLPIKNLTLLMCNEVKCLRVENTSLEDIIIAKCDSLQNFALECPLLKSLRLKANKFLDEMVEMKDVIAEIKKKYPSLNVYLIP